MILYKVFNDEKKAIQLVKSLSDKINLNFNDKNLLHYAAIYGKAELVSSLINNIDLDVEVEDEMGCTPLHLAVINGHLYVVKILVEKLLELKKSIDCKEKCEENTPLFYSIELKNYHIAEYLLSNGADLKVTNKFQKTVLHVCATVGTHEIMELLLKQRNMKGLDVNAYDNNKQTALHYAVSGPNPSFENIKLLIGAGADKSLLDKYDKPACHYAIIKGDDKVSSFLNNSCVEDLYLRDIHRLYI